jgi:hypothetical protein
MAQRTVPISFVRLTPSTAPCIQAAARHHLHAAQHLYGCMTSFAHKLQHTTLCITPDTYYQSCTQVNGSPLLLLLILPNAAAAAADFMHASSPVMPPAPCPQTLACPPTCTVGRNSAVKTDFLFIIALLLQNSS